MKKGKHYKSRKETNHNNTKKYIVFLLFIFMVCVIYLFSYFWDTKQEKEEIHELLVNEENTERITELQKLQEDNPDIVGWIEIEGTNINYPVLQTTDNDFYMNHNYKKEENNNGSLFLDKNYNWDIPSSNLLIYGHNKLDGAMFSDLLKYQKEDFYQEHPSIRFTTKKEDSNYEIIAAFFSRVYYKSEKNVFRYYQFIHAENEQEYYDYIENCKKSSLYDTQKTAKYGDQLITLSTCSYHTEDGRFAVVARKTE